METLLKNRRCTNCVMDTSDQNITFDSQGICDHCMNFFLKNQKIWTDAISGKRIASLKKIASKIRSEQKNKKYDCLVGVSGGPDSSYMLHYIVKVLKLRPLVFHVDAGWNTKQAIANIKRLTDKLNVKLYVKVMNWETMRGLQLAFFKSGVSHLDTPQDHAFFATMYHYANKHNIKYILNGGNLSTESVVVPLDWMYYTTDVRQLKHIALKHGKIDLSKFPLSSALYHKFYLRFFKGIKVVKPLDFIPYFKKSAVKALELEYGFEPFKNKHGESAFTRFYEGYWLPKRFGYDTRKVTFSSMILTGQMTRKDALRNLESPALSEVEIQDCFSLVSKKLRVSEDELNNFSEIPIKSFNDFQNQSIVYRLGAKTFYYFNRGNIIKR